ncbi:MAG: glycosyltransferase family 87 protein [Halobacteriaceae archaeon]
MEGRTRQLGVRAVLAGGLLAGLVTIWHLAATKPALAGVNLRTYRLAALALERPAQLYTVAPPGFPDLTWLYPPLVAVVFLPIARLEPFGLALAAHTGVLIIAGMALGGTLLEVIEAGGGDVSPVDRALIFGISILSPHAAPSLYYGNINPVLALALAGALLAAERRRPWTTGSLLAVPATIKVFPAGFGLWILWRREWREAAAALLVGILVVLGSLGLVGLAPLREYGLTVLVERGSAQLFVNGLDPAAQYVTLWRALSYVLPATTPVLLGASLLLLAAPVGVVLYGASPSTTVGRIAALHVTVIAVLLAIPSYAVYVVFAVPTLVCLLYVLPAGRAHTIVTAGAGLSMLTVTLGSLRDLGLDGLLYEVLRPPLTLGSPQLWGLLLTLLGVFIWVGTDGGSQSAQPE